MDWRDRLKVYFYHRKRVKTWKDKTQESHARSLGWSSHYAQVARFSAIAYATDFENRCVVDLGCGYGQLFDYLSNLYSLQRYIGVDQQAHFLKQAKALHPDPRCEFIAGDLSTVSVNVCDVVIASGSLNYKSRDDNYLTNVITHMYEMAGECVIFNLLDSSSYPEQPLLTGYNKQGVYRFCLTLCDDVVIIDGYSQDDFTVVMKKH
ncbi:class I SAM-dependent methyltransferase [Vibrio sp. 99-70-13A1]|uniref:class I SAM-dependent methyltransferase n=1 Tax=Vibrio sp. 99-70-13A1 TaxID=2607601 RepID=UPI001493D3FD|nr:class I SAM-dependent methyltransferase [Vibrio sp. 99-70-13A1]NOH98829.1 class I SAM-dependent methyltransferase [Vibrio sp. 99-70-13A1]